MQYTIPNFYPINAKNGMDGGNASLILQDTNLILTKSSAYRTALKIQENPTFSVFPEDPQQRETKVKMVIHEQ